MVFYQTGGLGHIHIPLLSDLNKQISRDYGVLLEGPGIALRWAHCELLRKNILQIQTTQTCRMHDKAPKGVITQLLVILKC